MANGSPAAGWKVGAYQCSPSQRLNLAFTRWPWLAGERLTGGSMQTIRLRKLTQEEAATTPCVLTAAKTNAEGSLVSPGKYPVVLEVMQPDGSWVPVALEG